MAKSTKAALEAAALLLNKAIDAALIVKSGKDYVFGVENLGASKDKAAAYLAEHGDVATAVEARLASQSGQGDQGGDDSSPAPDLALPESTVSTTLTTPEPPTSPVSAVTLTLPLPANVPAETLKDASIVVKAKAQRGRWRARRFFSREETLIPYAELSEDDIAALTGDHELVVGLRLPKPD